MNYISTHNKGTDLLSRCIS